MAITKHAISLIKQIFEENTYHINHSGFVIVEFVCSPSSADDNTWSLNDDILTREHQTQQKTVTNNVPTMPKIRLHASTIKYMPHMTYSLTYHYQSSVNYTDVDIKWKNMKRNGVYVSRPVIHYYCLVQ